MTKSVTMDTDVKIISGEDLFRIIRAVAEAGGQHVMGVDRRRAQRAFEAGMIKEGWTLTFYDDSDQDADGTQAYCFGRVDDGRIIVTHKTYGTLSIPASELH